ncbi:condensation domain-containing protein, partial [Streptomyces sp. NPDC060000]|uniref:condensation domain-containing protein n=1 Tax=Streptomyces sp. NPDC060000 TaxID=3347031 RepID=UPI00369C7139
MTSEAPLANALAGLTPGQRARLTLELARRKATRKTAVPVLSRTPGAENAFPSSPGQERLWYLHALEPDSTAYVLPIVLRLRGAVDVTALQGSLGALVARHEALRTVFREGRDGQIQQIVLPGGGVPLPVTDAPAGEDEDTLWRRVREEVSRPFDLARGPLVRARLLRRADSGAGPEAVLVLCVHHIVVDGWSLGVLVGELAENYAARVAGRPPVLPPLAVQYADFAVWQRESLSGERLAEQLSFWRTELEGAPILDVPGDRSRSAEQSFAGDSVRVGIPASLVSG